MRAGARQGRQNAFPPRTRHSAKVPPRYARRRPCNGDGPWGRGHLALARADRRACPNSPSNRCALRRMRGQDALAPRPRRSPRHSRHTNISSYRLVRDFLTLASLGCRRTRGNARQRPTPHREKARTLFLDSPSRGSDTCSEGLRCGHCQCQTKIAHFGQTKIARFGFRGRGPCLGEAGRPRDRVTFRSVEFAPLGSVEPYHTACRFLPSWRSIAAWYCP